MSHRFSLAGFCILASSIMGPASARGAGDDAFADVVISYVPGVGGTAAYNIAGSSLGSPHRVSGECFGSTDIITAFSPSYCPDEVVSIGGGGELVVKFNTPVTDDPNNLYGIDLIVFGNAGFIDLEWPSGVVDGLFSEGGSIEVSVDGSNWIEAKGAEADGAWPTVAYNDANAYAQIPGNAPSDYTRPMDPLLTLNDFLGLDNSELLQRYRGSGGGTGIDLGVLSLNAISYVRITMDENLAGAEIDAFADVTPRRPGDVDLDGSVNVDDLLLVINAWGAIVAGGPPADFDLSGTVNVDDLLTVINHWGR